MTKNEMSASQLSRREEILRSLHAAGWSSHEDMRIFDEGRDVPYPANLESFANGLHFRVFYEPGEEKLHFRAGGIFDDEFQLQIVADDRLPSVLDTIARVRDVIHPGDFEEALIAIVHTGAATYAVIGDEQELVRLVDEDT